MYNNNQSQRHWRPTGGPATGQESTRDYPDHPTYPPYHSNTPMVQQQQTKKQTTTTTTTHQHPHPHPQHQPSTTSTHPQSSAKDNVILLHIGLSASSHAKSHDLNKSFGWWEKFIGHGPNYPIDLDRYFVICTNVLGSCYGSTGPPSSINPETNEPMGPISQSSQSFTRISKLFASVGSSMGGMQSIVTAWLKPQRAQRMVSISGCGRTGPSSIALQYAQQSGLSTGGTSEDPGQTVGLDNGCKQSPETDWVWLRLHPANFVVPGESEG
ncbi:Alpha/Beta hydrolase protein [Phakopsora pachyrhizi]|nr:Alpha/Beta hydrolase protein [Phakopsora pachyrhizi]